MNEQPLKEYVCLEKRKKDLTAELKQIQADLDRLETVVIDEMVRAGVQKVEVDGRTLKIVPAVFCSPVENRWAVVEALKEAGLDQFIPQNYNEAQLRGFVKETAAEVFARADQEDRVATAEEIA
ncbi:MAG: hypothetical protein ABSF25_24015, partial [Bryobacteraceae bacterium]